MIANKSRYGLEDLLQAFRDAAGPPLYGLDAFRRWNEQLLEAFCRAFGVRFDDTSVSEAQRPLLALLRDVLKSSAGVPHPTRSYLDDSLVNLKYPDEMRGLAEAARTLEGHYRRVAIDLARRLWGDIGFRTNEELAAAGLDRNREPRLDDYMDEI